MDNNQQDKISKLLSDPQSLMTLATLAKTFLGNQNLSSKNENENNVVIQQVSQKPQEDTPVLPASTSPQQGTIQQSLSQFDERANLLRSIKPYLKEERQSKVDSLVRALNIAKIISNYKE